MITTFTAAKENIPFTPALVIDQPAVQRNIQRLAKYASDHHLKVRPHTKTHKSRLIAHWQVEAGATGLTFAKVGEMEALQELSSDLLLAYPAIDSARQSRLVELAREKTVRVAFDSAEGIDRLAAAARAANVNIGVLVDLDVGHHRTGVGSPALAVELARRVNQHGRSLQLDGIFFYPGHVWAHPSEQEATLKEIDEILAEAIDLFRSDGLSTEIVSGGSTPTLHQSHLITTQTEIRPGTYVYNDMNSVHGGYCSWNDLAAAIVCTVVSTSVTGKAVIDGGSKTLTSDRNITKPDSGHGFVLEFPAAKITRLSEEHGELDLSGCEIRPRVGDRVTVIPNHICPCINLQNQVWLQQADGSVRPLTVDSRGSLV